MTGPHPLRALGLAAMAALLGVVATAPTAAQKPAEASAPRWPELERKQKARITKLTKDLRQAKDPEVMAKLEADIADLGAAAAPRLLDLLSDYRKNINPSLTRVLDSVTVAEHAPLLAQRASDKRVAVRRYVVQRLSGFGLPEMAPIFREARKDEEADIAFQASIGLCAAGDMDALPEIFERCVGEWADIRERLAQPLEAIRGIKASRKVLALMRGDDDRRQIAGLRLLRLVGEKAVKGLIAPYLDTEVHGVKKEAINALRVVVDGEPPLDELSVFQAIEMAKTWKEKL
ncbi:MAG: hypothetical protein AAF628_18890 [Planctomycetota bacterium]